AKYIGQLLEEIKAESTDLKRTAVVLGDETLIEPLLNSIPASIDSINVTMGFPLKSVPLSTLFERLFYIHLKTGTSYYYKDVLALLSNKEVQIILKDHKSNLAIDLVNRINTNNILFISYNDIKDLAPEKIEALDLLFGKWKTSKEAISSCKKLIMLIKSKLAKSGNEMIFEYLYRFNKLFNELERLNDTYNYFDTLSSLHSVYKELLSSETMDFRGEPLEGLQIMGMLESRVLDFETVIISSVNEGILPAGKTNNSFIPFDVKRENELPTYKEKDAVYTYHFYRLLQRAKNVYIIYNTELDALTGGEPSRFINQLKLEGIHNITYNIASPQVPYLIKSLKQVKKTDPILSIIKELSISGFSPSSLTNYIRNPLDFYYQKILGVKDFDAVEETIATNTLGSVIHNALEEFYNPFINHELNVAMLSELLPKIDSSVQAHFKDLYKKGDLSQGKNLIILEVAKRYISNFIQSEIKQLSTGATIKILGIEQDFKVELDISELDFPVILKGKIDRIDEFNGTTRVIDYKTGYVEQSKVEIINWNDLTLDYEKYSKPFQLLSYCYALHLSKSISLPVTTGIISFKNSQKGFLPFSKKDKAGNGAVKEQLVTEDTLTQFRIQLHKLILEICDQEQPFVEKELDHDYSNELSFT
ncbi:MAG: PD-(D/E)XK nuclease family protein, partial [Winogradskyella sp.]|nr:PD-(D/E)XK nuclease family protein [Winogradskyella sp.]